jgi:tripartite-type tricarboxylate transporter receptor subunit TctC
VIVCLRFSRPAGTPRGVVHQLNAEINRILQQPEMRERFLNISMVPVGGTREAPTLT